jgi:type II secretory pathway predicted ATPase ExeA
MEKMLPDFGSCLKNWGFSSDPFVERYPVGDGFWAGPRGKLNHLAFSLKTASKQSTMLNILITGEYGSGKTYLLRSLQRFVESDLKGLGIFFEIPWKTQTRGFRDIHESVLHVIGSERIRSIGKAIAGDQQIQQAAAFKEYLSKLEIGIPNDVAGAIANIVFDHEVGLTWTWLQANATIYQQRSLGFDTNPRDERIAVDVLYGLFNYLGLAYPIVALFIDELENLIGESAAVRSIRSGFRNLYETILYGKHNPKIASFSAASATLLYQLELTLGTAVLDRFDERIELAPLSDDEAKNFITELIAKFRAIADGHLPFEDENALREFLQRARVASVLATSTRGGGPNTPRRLIKAGKLLLKYACEESSYPLSSTFIANHLI